MWIYYLILIIALGIYLMIYRKYTCNKYYITATCREKKKIESLCAFLFLLIFLIMVLRSVEVGTDTADYAKEYNDLTSLNLPSSLKSLIQGEHGFFWTELIFRKLGIPWFVFNACYSAFVCYAVAQFLIANSYNLFVSYWIHITFGVFVMSLTGIQQSFAVAFVLLAFVELEKRKYLRFCILVLVATTFHFSAIVCLSFLGLSFIKRMKRRYVVVIACVPFIIRLVGTFLLSIMTRFLPKRYWYSGYFEQANYKLNPLVEILHFAILLACCVGMLIIREEVRNRFAKMYILVVGCVACIELSNAIYIAVRFSFYFVSAVAVLIPNILGCLPLRRKKERTWITMLICAMFLLYFAIAMSDSSYGIDNYKFFWG